MYMCIDLKSFYASVECVIRHLNPFNTPLVVCDIKRSKGAITLAVTPYLKKCGIPSRTRAYTLPRDIPIIYALPRMKKYIEYSSIVYSCYLHFFSRDDIYMYSIDEGFMNITPYLNYYKITPLELAKRIKKYVFEKTGLTVTVGIGDNMFQAKVALDVLSKHSKEEIGLVTSLNFKDVIGTVTPLNKIWCIGDRIMYRLNKMGVFCLNDILEVPKEKIYKEFGIIGLEIIDHANGLDSTQISEAKNINDSKKKSISEGQILFKDYHKDNARYVMSEMINELSLKLNKGNYKTNNISLFIGYSDSTYFAKQFKLYSYTSSYTTLLINFNKIYESVPDGFIRHIGVCAQSLRYDDRQLSLFFEKEEKENHILTSVNNIRKRYGKNSCIKGISLMEDANQIERNKMIGGHNAEY